jgi:hypothetical protein
VLANIPTVALAATAATIRIDRVDREDWKAESSKDSGGYMRGW